MKTLNVFNLIVVLLSAFFTWNAIAAPNTVHVLQNLSPSEAKVMMTGLEKMGYHASKKELFNESKTALVVTKVLPTENEGASISVEMLQMTSDQSIPQTIFQFRMEGSNIHEMLSAFPRAEIMNPDLLRPLAQK